MSPAWGDEVIGDVFSEPQQVLSLLYSVGPGALRG